MPSSSIQVVKCRDRCRASASCAAITRSVRRHARTIRSTCAAVPARATSSSRCSVPGVATRVIARTLAYEIGPARHRGADERQSWQGPSHPHLLACGPQIDPGAPVQPVRARRTRRAKLRPNRHCDLAWRDRAKRPGPAAALVVLAQHDQQLVGGGVDAGGQLGDALAKRVDRHRIVTRGGQWRERRRRRSRQWRRRGRHGSS